jgi:hypothetical protein
MRYVWLIVSLLVCKSATCQEIVSNDPLSADQLIATLPVLGLRKFPADKVIAKGTSENGEWIVNPTAAVRSALSDARYREQLSPYDYVETLEPNAAFEYLKTAHDVHAKAVGNAMQLWEAGYLEKAGKITLNRKEFAAQSNLERKFELNKLLSKDLVSKGGKYYIHFGTDQFGLDYDPEVVGNIVAANKRIKDPANTTAWSYSDLSLDSSFATGLRDVYESMKSVSPQASEVEKIAAVSNGIQAATADLPVATSILVKAGDAGIGRPLIFTAAEKNLKIERSLMNQYDIYWIQFAVNPSEELAEQSLELRYDIAIQDANCLALNIQPDRVGVKESVRSVDNTPDVKVGNVEVGEMYSRTIEYQHIRPTILGHGVQLPSFGWIFSDEALDASTKRLFAVVGVPKNQKEISTEMSVTAKLKGYFGTTLESQWGSTGPTAYTFQLPR